MFHIKRYKGIMCTCILKGQMENRETPVRLDFFFFHRIVNETEHIFSHPERSTSILHTQKFLDASNKNSFLNSMNDRSSYLSRATY